METGSKTTPDRTSASEFFDLHYANEPASYYYLVLQLEKSSVRACWYHFAKNLVTGYASYALDSDRSSSSLKDLLSKKAFLKAEFKEVIVLLGDTSFCLVPNLLKDFAPSELLHLTNDVQDGETLHSARLVNLKATAIYTAPSYLEELLDRTWPKHQLLPAQLPLIEEMMNQLKRATQKTRVVAQVKEENLDILAFKDGKLVLANTYFQSGKEDVAYYLLYAAEILDIDPENAPLVLTGHIAPEDATWQLLGNYWRTMKVAKELSHLKLSDSTSKAPNSRFASLTYALLCAS